MIFTKYQVATYLRVFYEFYVFILEPAIDLHSQILVKVDARTKVVSKDEETFRPTYPYFKSSFAETHEKICSYKKPHVLLWVYTAVKNFRHRKAIRNTWGMAHLYHPIRVSLLFSMAGTNNSKIQKLVNREHRTYNDIVQDNGFIDSYKNLSYKVIALILPQTQA